MKTYSFTIYTLKSVATWIVAVTAGWFVNGVTLGLWWLGLAVAAAVVIAGQLLLIKTYACPQCRTTLINVASKQQSPEPCRACGHDAWRY